MILAKKYNPKDFMYMDSGFMRSGIFTMVRLLKCDVCDRIDGRGFIFKNKVVFKNDPENTFVCLGCSLGFFNQNNFKLVSRRQISFIEPNIIRRYSDLRKRFKEGKIDEDNFTRHYKQFAKFIYPIIIEHINYLIDLDMEYIDNHERGTEWRGWWLGTNGKEINRYLDFLKDAVNNQRTKDKSISMKLIDSLFPKYSRLLRVHNKFTK